jgi:F0F1-type ATP synthase beta subunit
VGENELSPADRADYQNAKKLIQFFSQDFAVAEHLSGKPGQYFSLEETLSGIEAILSGKEPEAQPTPTKTSKPKEKEEPAKAPADTKAS